MTAVLEAKFGSNKCQVTEEGATSRYDASLPRFRFRVQFPSSSTLASQIINKSCCLLQVWNLLEVMRELEMPSVVVGC